MTNPTDYHTKFNARRNAAYKAVKALAEAKGLSFDAAVAWLEEKTERELAGLQDETGESITALIARAVDRLHQQETRTMQKSIMVNERNGYYEIRPNAEPEDWYEVRQNGTPVYVESLTGWEEYTSVWRIDTKWEKTHYFVAE